MSLSYSPPQSPVNTSSPSIEPRTYPIRYYNPQLIPTFESSESENSYRMLSESMEMVKPIVSSLSPDKYTMTRLNIEKIVKRTFERASLDITNVMGLPMYKTLVYEFLASFRVKHRESMYDENSAWEFRIQNTNFQWTRKEATQRLGFPLFGVPARATIGQRISLWTRLTKQNQLGTISSPYSFIDRAWFYTHRLVATGINARPETVDQVTMEDLNIMWALSEGNPIDWFDVFSERFDKMRNFNSNIYYAGCTSLITFIAKVCGFQFCCHWDDCRKLDHACLKRMRLLTRTSRALFHPGVNTDTPIHLIELHDSEESSDPEEDPEEKGECSTKQQRKRKSEVIIKELNDNIPWKAVKKVTVYEF